MLKIMIIISDNLHLYNHRLDTGLNQNKIHLNCNHMGNLLHFLIVYNVCHSFYEYLNYVVNILRLMSDDSTLQFSIFSLITYDSVNRGIKIPYHSISYN